MQLKWKVEWGERETVRRKVKQEKDDDHDDHDDDGAVCFVSQGCQGKRKEEGDPPLPFWEHGLRTGRLEGSQDNHWVAGKRKRR